MFIWHSALSVENSFSSSGLADFGGRHGSPAKQNLTTLLIIDVDPFDSSLSDDRKSYIIDY